MNKTCDDKACNDEGVSQVFARHPILFHRKDSVTLTCESRKISKAVE